MRGHIRRRCTRCSATVNRGRTCKRCGAQTLSYGWTCDAGRDASGKRLQRSGAGFATRRDAERALRAEIKRLEDGGDPFPEKQTLETFAARWLEHKDVRPRTLERYRDLLRLHVLPEIGRLELGKVRPAHVERVLDAMKDDGLSPATIVQTRAVLGGIMRQALEWQLVTTNPVAAVKRPRTPDHRRRKRPTPEQLRAFIEAARADPVWEIPMLLGATTGARRSEVLAIAWSAVDLPAGAVRIVRSLQKTAPGHSSAFFDEVKSEHGRRTIGLPPAVAERLRLHRKEQLERRMELGAAWHDDADLDLVCDRGDGLYLEPDAMTAAFRPIAATAGLPIGMAGFHLHDLRHGVATAMLLAGIQPAVTSAVLGHADPAFTMRTYQEVTATMTRQAADALGKALDV